MSAVNTFGWSYRADEEFRTELEKLVTVIEDGTGGGYEWDEFVAYWHPEKHRFFYVSGSGCSCNSISDGINSLADFESVQTKGELIVALKREKDTDYGWSQSELLDAINAIQNFRGV